MPSPVGHFLAGATAGWLVNAAPRAAASPVERLRIGVLFGTLALLPDLDLLAGMHSGPTHSLGAAAIVGALAFGVARARGIVRPGRLALACALAYSSHVLLDWLGSDDSPPIGIMALWPVTNDYFESDLHVFNAIRRRYDDGWTFVRLNGIAVLRELIVLVPLLLTVWYWRVRRIE
jgi:membrane-bound metal-dependent hydrolase YbcI (DUF457 family)